MLIVGSSIQIHCATLLRVIEDIYFFEVITKYISLSVLKLSELKINLPQKTHRTTGCFDDRLLTRMTDTGFLVA